MRKRIIVPGVLLIAFIAIVLTTLSPPYFRRSAIAEAFGILPSHRSRYERWMKERTEAERAGRHKRRCGARSSRNDK